MNKVTQVLEAVAVLAIIALLLFVARNAPAADLLLGQHTHHFQPTYNWDACQAGEEECGENFNDSQELVGVATDKWAAIYMHQNSVRNKSVVVVRTFKRDFGPYLRPFAAVGVATGYAKEYDKWSAGGVTPTAYFGVDLHLKSDKVGVVLTWQPDCFIGAGLRFSIN